MLLLGACAAAPAPDLRASLTRAQIDRATTPLMLVEVPARGAQATLIPSGQNGGVQSWRTGDNVGLSFDGGVLVGTRGLGDDLMAADVTGTLAALAGGPSQQYPRIHSYLDGENQTQFRAFLCDMAGPVAETVTIFGRAVPTRRFDETCHSVGLQTANSYRVGADGTMWTSRQWIGPTLEYLMTERLAP
ncbi:MAG: YjbF family lipoprotein [Rhodobacterales bacterium]|nr:YjbF family lipoprotein [Rhodobacterales bacterium]